MVQIFNTILETALDSNGNPINGAQLFIFEAGTTTKLTTFSDSALTTANTNPLIADSAGRFITIYGNPDDYKFVLAPANDTDPPTSPIKTTDDYVISATTSFSGGINASGETEHLINAQTGTSYTILDGDRAKLVTHSNASTIAVTLPQAASSVFEAGWYYDTFVTGAGTVTITPITSTINGLATLTLAANSGCMIVSDGTNYQIEGLYSINPGVNAQTGTSYTVVAGDLNKLVTFTNASAIAVTLPQANSTTFKSGWTYITKNLGAGIVTITPTTSTIDGAATLTLGTNDSARITSDGTNYQSSLSFRQGWVLLETQTASASSEIEFDSNIDSTFTKYVILIQALRNSATAIVYMQVSVDGGSVYLTGYDFHTQTLGNASASYSAIIASGATQISMTDTIASVGSPVIDGMIILNDPTNGGANNVLSGNFQYTRVSNDAAGGDFYAAPPSSSGINAIRIYPSSGNWTVGTFKLYGIT